MKAIRNNKKIMAEKVQSPKIFRSLMKFNKSIHCLHYFQCCQSVNGTQKRHRKLQVEITE